MPRGSMLLQLSDVAGRPVPIPVTLDLTRMAGDAGTGGANAVVVNDAGVTELTVAGISCRGGVGTQYRVAASSEHFKTYQFLQRIEEGRVSQASDLVRLWVKPSHVSDIRAPGFDQLAPRARAILDRAAMVEDEPEDRDLLGLQGAALYDGLGPLRRACFLNLVTKAAHRPTTGDLLGFVQGLLVARQDRFFAVVDPALVDHVTDSDLFTSERNTLHDPLPGYRLTASPSFKSEDAHANIQVTFMTHLATGALAADIDIDESTGIRHGFEVIENALFRRRTNPYLIREFMAIADRRTGTLIPPYEFVF